MPRRSLRSGLRIRGHRGHPAVRAAFLRYASWLRTEIEFPLRVPVYLLPGKRVRTVDGQFASASIFLPWSRGAQSLHGEGHSYRPISELRRIAVETVARRRHVTSSTVAEKFVRQLRPQVQGTADFDRLLEGHLQKSSPALRDILLAHATGQDDELRIIRTLTADATELSSRNRGTPTATTTHSSMHT